jgi:site-specific DNA-cytosine methylase
MNVLSLFDGMSCGQIALERAGISVARYYASEVDKHAIAVTQANYPKTIQLGDVTKWREWGLDWGSVDLLIGGSPCQGFSSAGKGLAFEDPRSGLFYAYADILRHLLAVNPRAKFLLENVKMKSEHALTISKALGVTPVNINSALVSAQNRERLYWANFHVTQPEDRGIRLGDILESGFADREKSYCLGANYATGASLEAYHARWRKQIVLLDNKGGWRKLTPTECEKLQTVPLGYTAHVSSTQRYKMLGNGWTVEVVAHLFRSAFNKEK